MPPKKQILPDEIEVVEGEDELEIEKSEPQIPGEQDDEETLEPEVEDQEETDESDSEPQETPQENEIPQASPIDVEALRAQLADDILSKVEQSLDVMYNRLKQSSRDTTRAEVVKQLKAQKAVLDKAVEAGQMSKEDARAILQDARDKAEEEVLANAATNTKDEPLPRLAKGPVSNANPMQSAFEGACNEVLRIRGVSLSDPDAKELLSIKIPSTLDFQGALKYYSDAVDRVAKAKSAKSSGNPQKSKKTPVDTGGKGAATSQKALLDELALLMRQNGGDWDARQKRNLRIRKLEAALNK